MFAMVAQFMDSVNKVSRHVEDRIDMGLTNLDNNVTHAINTSSNNAKLISGTILNFSKYNVNTLKNFSNMDTTQLQNLNRLIADQMKLRMFANGQLQNMTNYLSSINKTVYDIDQKLTIVPVTPIPLPTPQQNKTCNIFSKEFPFCILPSNNPIHTMIHK